MDFWFLIILRMQLKLFDLQRPIDPVYELRLSIVSWLFSKMPKLPSLLSNLFRKRKHPVHFLWHFLEKIPRRHKMRRYLQQRTFQKQVDFNMWSLYHSLQDLRQLISLYELYWRLLFFEPTMFSLSEQLPNLLNFYELHFLFSKLFFIQPKLRAFLSWQILGSNRYKNMRVVSKWVCYLHKRWQFKLLFLRERVLPKRLILLKMSFKLWQMWVKLNGFSELSYLRWRKLYRECEVFDELSSW